MNPQERFSRQKDIIPIERLRKQKVSIVGVGAIGRNVATQLTSIGVSNLQLIDFDTVEESNVASQGFFETDIGKPKVEATRDFCYLINKEINIETINKRYGRTIKLGDVVFSCVDSIETRKFIWENGGEFAKLLIDGRMAAEVLRVLTITGSEDKEYYPKTFFTAEEAHRGSCTAKTTIYCANIAAGIMISGFTKWLREFPIDRDMLFNIIAGEMTYGDI